MPHRFFCTELPQSGTVTLSETEFHHLVHVLRHQLNDRVEVFNGTGVAASCRIAAIRKREAELEILSSASSALPTKKLTVATAVPKGDRLDWLIEKATELGVSALIPLTTARSVVDPRASKLDKLRQTVITACKQCGRNHLMSIAAVTSWDEFLRMYAVEHQILVAHPGRTGIDQISEKLAHQSLAVAIGPEGGFADEEIEKAIAMGASAIQLGQNVLRIETAAIGLAAKLLL